MWTGYVVLAIGLVDVPVTRSERHLLFFVILALAFMSLDYFFRSAQANRLPPSIFGPNESLKPKPRAQSRYVRWAYPPFYIAGCCAISFNVRIAALLWLCAILISVFGGYLKIDSNRGQQALKS
jgi:hypothetical protein